VQGTTFAGQVDGEVAQSGSSSATTFEPSTSIRKPRFVAKDPEARENH